MHGLFEACRLSDHHLDHVAGGSYGSDCFLGSDGIVDCYTGPSRPTGQGPGGASPSKPLAGGGTHFRLP